MTPDQVAGLLSYAAAVDPRVRRNDPDERRMQAAAWHAQLRGVDLDAARAAVDRHYATPGADAVMPGDIRGTEHGRLPQSRTLAASIAASDRADAAERAREPLELEPGEAETARQRALEVAARAKGIADKWALPAPTGYVPKRNRTAGRRPAGAPTQLPTGPPMTVCHRCVNPMTPPPGFNPADVNGPPVFCDPCQVRLGEIRKAAG